MTAIPHDDNIERQILGAILFDNSCLPEASDLLKEDDFYSEAHQLIWREIKELEVRGSAIDILILSEAMRKHGALDRCGGMEYLTSIASETFSTVGFEEHCKIVQEKAIRRTFMREIAKAKEDSENPSVEVDALVAQVEQAAYAAGNRKEKRELRNPASVLREVVEMFQAQAQGIITGTPTGFQDIDRHMCGMNAGELITIGARPAMGKTAICLDIARNVAKQGKSVAFFSLEMSRKALMARALCQEARINQKLFKRGQATPADLESIRVAVENLRQSRLYIDDTPRRSPSQIVSACKRMKSKIGLDLVIIDNAQIMGSDRFGRQDDYKDMKQNTGRLKELAKELEVPVILISHLGRQVEHREDKRPILSDLKESGTLEQDSDIVIFLYRDEVYNPEAEAGMTEVIFAKYRENEVGMKRLRFEHQYVTFSDYVGSLGQNPAVRMARRVRKPVQVPAALPARDAWDD